MSSKSIKAIANIGRSYLVKHPWQSILMIIGIMLGVAVVVAIDLANESAARGFDLSTEAVSGRTTHQVVAGPGGIDESIYVKLRRSGVIQDAAPIIRQYVSSPRSGLANLELLGVDPFSEAPFRDYFNPGAGSSSVSSSPSQLTDFLTAPGAILISYQLAERLNLGIGDEFSILVDGKEQITRISGLMDSADPLSQRALQNLVVTDISTAQELTGKYGMLDHIDLIISEGQSGERMKGEIFGLLPDGTRLQPVSARQGTIDQMTKAFRINLTALSLLALLVGLFLIYNTMTFSVVKRRSLFGTMRSIGITRREVFLLVVLEAFLIGLIGTGLGIFVGILMGQGAIRIVTQTVNDLFFVVTVRGVQIPTESLVKGALLGILATVLTAAPPAWEAASVQPRAALIRSGLERKAQKVVILAAAGGTVLLILGVIILALPTSDLIISFAGTLAVIIGFSGLAPAATLGLMKLIRPVSGKYFGMLGRMAPRDVSNSLSRTGIAIAALMVAVSVTIGVSLMVSSFRYTVILWLEQTLQGDVYISVAGQTTTQPSSPIDSSIIPLVENWKGVSEVQTLRAVTVDSPLGPIQIAATTNPNVGSERQYLSLSIAEDELGPALQAGSVLLSEPLANRLDLPVGSEEITLFTDVGEQIFPVAGIYYDYSSPQGTLLLAQPVYRQFFDDDAITAIALYLDQGIDPDSITQELREGLSTTQLLNIRPNVQLRSEALEVFDRTFEITTALQLLATTVAFIGVLSALLSLELERSRELGILRAVGLTIRQIWGLILGETSLLGGAAGLLAMPTGYVLALILIYIINKRSFGWTLQMDLSAAPFILAFIVAVSAAVLAGIYPAWRMSRIQEIDAIRME